MPPDRPEVLLRKAKQDELAVEKLLDDGDIEDDLLGFHTPTSGETGRDRPAHAVWYDVPLRLNLDRRRQ